MALKDKLMTLEDFKAVRDVDVASNSAQFTEIKADLGALSASALVSETVGIEMIDGSGSDEIALAGCIKGIKMIALPRTGAEVVIPEIRFIVCQNTEQSPKYLTMMSSNNKGYAFDFGDGDTATVSKTDGTTTVIVTVSVDWDKVEGILYNKAYSVSKVRIAPATSLSMNTAENSNKIENAQNTLNNVSIIGDIKTRDAEVTSVYINYDGTVISYANHDTFGLRAYSMSKGESLIIAGDSVRLNNAYPLVCFGNDYSVGVRLDIIKYASTTPEDVKVVYTATEDGYLIIAFQTVYNSVNVYQTFDQSALYTYTNTDFGTPINMQLFGDSITDDSWRDDGTWATVFQSYFPQRTWNISNDAVGGSHMGHGKVNSETGKYHDLDYNYVYDLITNADIFKPNSDIIVVFAGTNDFNSSPLGQYGDTGTSTFYGALRSVCEYLSAHTEAKVFFVTPIARPTDADASKEENADGEKINAYGATLRDYADAIKRVCAFYQYPVIDLFYEIGWNATNVKPYMDAVGVHPNIKGSKVISQYITGEIKKHFGI